MGKKTIGRGTSKIGWRKKLEENFLLTATHFAIVREKTPGLMKQEAAKSGMSVRTAYYLADLHDKYRPLRIAPSRLLDIGWTKLQIIGPYINKSNCDQLLNLAEENTARDLALLIQNEIPEPGTRCVILYLAPQDYAIFEAVLIKHGAEKYSRGLLEKEISLMKALAHLSSTKLGE